jgi:phage terminase small subunit
MTTLTNAKHEAVAQAFIADSERIGWRAYHQVYPESSKHTAENCFSRLMKKDEFSARIAELAEQAAQVAVMTAHEVLVELTKIARANMLDYVRVGPNGDPVLHFSELTRDQAAVLCEVTVEHFMDGAGEAREVRRTRFKLVPKIPALELLGKHHKLYVNRHEHDWSAGLADRLNAALKRVDAWQKSDPYYRARAGLAERLEAISPEASSSAPPAARRHEHARKAARKGRRAPRRRQAE